MTSKTKQLTAGERLALLKSQHGGLSEAVKKTTEFTYIVYNDTTGDILYKSIQEPEIDKFDDNCKVYKFKTSDTKIIDSSGKSIAQFSIEQGEHDICHIKLKSVEKPTLKTDRDFLSEVDIDKANPDVTISYNSIEWTLTIHNTAMEFKLPLVFYITPDKDPHILLERVVFDIAAIVDNRVSVQRKADLPEAFSIYAHKLNRVYSRQA